MNAVITGTLLTENLNAKVLFDPRVTHSFISVNLACKLSKPEEKLKQILVVNTFLGRVLPVTNGVKSVRLR